MRLRKGTNAAEPVSDSAQQITFTPEQIEQIRAAFEQLRRDLDRHECSLVWAETGELVWLEPGEEMRQL